MASNSCCQIVIVFCVLLYLNDIKANEIFGAKRNNLRSEMKKLKKFTSALEDSLKTLALETNARIDALETDMRSKLEEFEDDIDSLRSDFRDGLTRTGDKNVLNATVVSKSSPGNNARKGNSFFFYNRRFIPFSSISHFACTHFIYYTFVYSDFVYFSLSTTVWYKKREKLKFWAFLLCFTILL